jgi:hypothetical protein
MFHAGNRSRTGGRLQGRGLESRLSLRESRATFAERKATVAGCERLPMRQLIPEPALSMRLTELRRQQFVVAPRTWRLQFTRCGV